MSGSNMQRYNSGSKVTVPFQDTSGRTSWQLGKKNTGTIFISGISASGKSTLGKRLLENLLKNRIANVKLLDGEEIRRLSKVSGRRYGYSTPDRNAHAKDIANKALELNTKGYIAIVCTIAHVKRTREEIRKKIGKFMEVYLECPVEVCARRDRKGHYRKAFANLYSNFIGVTEMYQRSDDVELTLNTDKMSVDECSEILLRQTLSFLRKVGA